MRSQAELAARSLQAKNYRTAMAYAEEVLAVVPDHAEAKTVRDQARAMVDRFDAAMAEARRLLEAGNAKEAARQLDAARAIDPIGPGVAELSVRLADQFRIQAETARTELQPSRPSAGPPPASPPPPVIPTAPPPSAPRGETPPDVQPPLPAGAAAAQAATPEAAAPPAKPTPPPVERPEPPEATAPFTEDDESAIRLVVATYARALETKNLALFRSVKPNLSREEEQRIEQGFRAVSSQRVNITILSIERKGTQATVRLSRRDTIEDRGTRQTTESQQTVSLTRSSGGWVIVEIGR